MDYSIKNLRDVEDSAPKFGFSEVQEARFARGDLEAEGTGLAYLIVRAGRRQAFAHRHENAEEIAVVVAGTGRVKLDDDLVDLQPLDAVRLSPGVTRQFAAGPDEDLQIIVFGPHHDSDGEIVQDFWTD
jgi:mannose-6-phosphate isomerase-like protein (cupin superfamily)